MEEMNQLKVFTVEEANRLIPHLTTMIQQLQQKREAIMTLEVEIDALELVADKDQSGVAPGVNRKVEEYNKTIQSFYNSIDEIHEMGCFLKDIDMGLVDFYSVYRGNMIYLCWKLGEPEVGHWHEIGRGFNYRQPIEMDTHGRESSG